MRYNRTYTALLVACLAFVSLCLVCMPAAAQDKQKTYNRQTLQNLRFNSVKLSTFYDVGTVDGSFYQPRFPGMAFDVTLLRVGVTASLGFYQATDKLLYSTDGKTFPGNQFISQNYRLKVIGVDLYYNFYSTRIGNTPVHIAPAVRYRSISVAQTNFDKITLPSDTMHYRFLTLGGADQFYAALHVEEELWLFHRRIGIRECFFLPFPGEPEMFFTSDAYKNRTYKGEYRTYFELKINYYLGRLSPVNPFKRKLI